MKTTPRQSIINTLCYIILAGGIGALVLWQADTRTLNNSVVYDGCYEQWAVNEMPADAYVSFMQYCMSK